MVWRVHIPQHSCEFYDVTQVGLSPSTLNPNQFLAQISNPQGGYIGGLTSSGEQPVLKAYLLKIQ